MPLAKQHASTRGDRGEIETELADQRVLITRMRGFVTATLCEARFEQFRRSAVMTTDAPWIIDTLDMTGFHPNAVQVGARWFDVFKQQGGSQIIMVSSMSAVRMAAATLAFAVHVKVTSFKAMNEAYEHAGLGHRSLRPSDYSFNPPKSGTEDS
jgi:hypothetical protein